jgi:hypothetical protein
MNNHICINVFQTLDCLEMIRTILEFVRGVNMGVSSWLSCRGVTPSSSLRSTSAVRSLLTTRLASKSISEEAAVSIEVKLGALCRLGVEVVYDVDRTLPPRSPCLPFLLKPGVCVEKKGEKMQFYYMIVNSYMPCIKVKVKLKVMSHAIGVFGRKCSAFHFLLKPPSNQCTFLKVG